MGFSSCKSKNSAFAVAERDILWPSTQCGPVADSDLYEHDLVKEGLSSSVDKGSTRFVTHKSEILIYAGATRMESVEGAPVHSYSLSYRSSPCTAT